jgi:hypothetical protein
VPWQKENRGAFGAFDATVSRSAQFGLTFSTYFNAIDL